MNYQLLTRHTTTAFKIWNNNNNNNQLLIYQESKYISFYANKGVKPYGPVEVSVKGRVPLKILAPSKRRKLLSNRQGVTSHKTWIFSNYAGSVRGKYVIQKLLFAFCFA
jgi:hypothetical protein